MNIKCYAISVDQKQCQNLAKSENRFCQTHLKIVHKTDYHKFTKNLRQFRIEFNKNDLDKYTLEALIKKYGNLYEKFKVASMKRLDFTNQFIFPDCQDQQHAHESLLLISKQHQLYRILQFLNNQCLTKSKNISNNSFQNSDTNTTTINFSNKNQEFSDQSLKSIKNVQQTYTKLFELQQSIYLNLSSRYGFYLLQEVLKFFPDFNQYDYLKIFERQISSREQQHIIYELICEIVCDNLSILDYKNILQCEKLNANYDQLFSKFENCIISSKVFQEVIEHIYQIVFVKDPLKHSVSCTQNFNFNHNTFFHVKNYYTISSRSLNLKDFQNIISCDNLESMFLLNKKLSFKELCFIFLKIKQVDDLVNHFLDTRRPRQYFDLCQMIMDMNEQIHEQIHKKSLANEDIKIFDSIAALELKFLSQIPTNFSRAIECNFAIPPIRSICENDLTKENIAKKFFNMPKFDSFEIYRLKNVSDVKNLQKQLQSQK